MASQWNIQIEGKAFGPFDDPALARLAREGRITPETPVRQNITGTWIRADRLKGLFSLPVPKAEVPVITPETLSPTASSRVVAAFTPDEPNILGEATYRSGYVTSNLLPEERVIAWADTHWFIFVVPATLLLIPAIIGLGAKITHGTLEAVCFSTIFLPFGLYTLASRTVQFLCNQYAVTTHRVIMKTGFLSLQTMEVFHDKIASIAVSQGLLGMFFNFGSVLISAMGDKQGFPYIAKPALFRRKVQEMQAQ